MEAVRVRARGSMAAILGGKVAHSVETMDPKALKLSAGARSFPQAKVHRSVEMTSTLSVESGPLQNSCLFLPVV